MLDLSSSSKIYDYYIKILFVFIVALVFLSPIFRGLYFEKDWNQVHILSFILFAIWLVFHKLLYRNTIFPNGRIDYVITMFLFSYLLSIIGAVSFNTAVGEALKVLNYVVIYIFVLTITNNIKSRLNYTRYLLDSLMFTGVVIALIGFAGASGSLQATALTEGARIQSTFQYHNANAIYLSAIFIIACSMSALQKVWYLKLPYLCAAIMLLVNIALTFSRGAWIVLFFCCIIYILLSIPGQRMKSLVYLTYMTMIVSFSVASFEHHFLINSEHHVFFLLAFVVLIMGIGVYFIEVAMSKLLNRYKSKYSFVIIILLTTLLLNSGFAHPTLDQNQQLIEVASSGQERSIPAESLLNRASDINLQTFSVTERFIYYRTALKIARDYPLTGAGGGSWEVLYLDYLEEWHPDFMYTTEIHNHYLKILIETGIFGLLSYLAIWVFFTIAFLRSRFSKENTPAQKQLAVTIFVPALALGAHGAIDFSLSLGAISIMLWILFALGISNADEKPATFIQEFYQKLSPGIRLLLKLLALSVTLILLTLAIIHIS